MANYFTLKVREVVKETPDAVTIYLKQPLFKKVKYKPGQFITLLLTINGQKVRRSYSMCSSPNLEGDLAITVKRVKDGLVSNYLNDQASSLSSLEIMEPMGNFTVEPDKARKVHYVLFGGGSGITPLMSILKSVLFFEPMSTVSLVYGNRNMDSVIFKSKLEELRQKFGDRLNIVHILENPPANWGSYSGLVDSVKVANILNLLPKAEQTEYYICGPSGMMDAVKEGLQKLKVPKERIHIESFVSAPQEQAAGAAFQTREVTVILDGTQHKITVTPDKSILDAGLDAGLDMPFSCQSGLCTACRGKCLSGKVEMVEGDGLSETEIADGYVLTCVGHPLTEDVVVEIG